MFLEYIINIHSDYMKILTSHWGAEKEQKTYKWCSTFRVSKWIDELQIKLHKLEELWQSNVFYDNLRTKLFCEESGHREHKAFSLVLPYLFPLLKGHNVVCTLSRDKHHCPFSVYLEWCSLNDGDSCFQGQASEELPKIVYNDFF